MSSKQDQISLGLDDLDPLMNSPKSLRLRVYLAGPMTNNDQEADAICAAVRRSAKQIYSEQDSPGFEVYDPSEITPVDSHYSAEIVTLKNRTSIISSDLVFINASPQSHGVGMEAQLAAGATVPTILAYPNDIRVSKMLQGNSAPCLGTIEYSSLRDFESQLRDLVPSIVSRLCTSKPVRDKHMARIASMKIGRSIFKERIVKRIALSDLSQKADIEEHLLKHLERDDRAVVLLTLMEQIRIGDVLGCEWKTGKDIELRTDWASRPGHIQTSLDNLAEYVVDFNRWVPDQKLFEVWSDYEERVTSMAKARGGAELVYSTKDWSQILSSRNNPPTLF